MTQMVPKKEMRRLEQENARLRTELQDHKADHRLIAELQQAYSWLCRMADPTPGPKPLDAPNGQRVAWEGPIPGEHTRRYRNKLRRVNRKLEALLDELVSDDEPRRGERLRCPVCGKAGRFGSKFCDRDGRELE